MHFWLFLLMISCVSLSVRSFGGLGRSICRQYCRSRLVMMPEGAEVRALTDTMELILCKGSHNQLVGTSLLSGRYTRTDPQGYEELQRRLAAVTTSKDKLILTAIKSKGKFIYFTFSDPEMTIWSTLGLTGGWTVERRRKHIRLALHFENLETKEATSLYFYDMRNFGTLRINFDAKDLDKKLQDLGYDWLCAEKSPTEDEFLDLSKNAAKRKRPLAVFLMDQKKTSGIGNYVLAEVLYRAGIHPFSNCADLDEGDWIDLYGHINAVLHSSYSAQRPVLIDANGQDVSRAEPYNNKKFSFRVYSRKVTPTGEPVTRMTGTHKRTIWFSPSEQEKYKPEGFMLPGE